MRNLFSTTKHFIKVLCCFCYLLIYKPSFCQTNLVPNPSFEQYTNCPNNLFSIAFMKATVPSIWFKPDIKSAVYWNRCTNNQPKDGVPYNFGGGIISYQEPKTGDAYLGMFYYNQNASSYIQVKLSDSLKISKKYYGEYFVSLQDSYLKGCNNIAMLFTKNKVYADTTTYPNLLQANPQIVSYGNPIITDTMNWVKISGIFTAQGGEQYLTLGNFKLASQTQFILVQPYTNPGYNGAAYYVDDVAVYNLDSFCLKADAGKDTTIKVGDSVFIGSYTSGIDTIKWYNSSGQVIDSTRPGFWVKPTSAGTYMYVVQQTVNGCFSADTVWVNVQALPLKIMSYELRVMNDNPNSSPRGNERSVENLWQTANEANVSHYNIERSVNGNDFTVVGKVKANNKATNNYNFTDQPTPNTQHQTWFYRIAGVDFDGRKTYSTTKQITIKPQTPNNVFVFPNPAKDVVNVMGSNIKEVKLFDMFGREIATGTNLRNDDSNNYQLNISSLPKGIYMLHIFNKQNNVYNEKIIVQ